MGETERALHVALAYLRASLIVLVVVHHVAQGFTPFLPAEPADSLAEHLQTIRAVSPVIDDARSELLLLFSGFNDTFFMSLLFLLSGLFVWPSFERKGAAGYLRDRVLRLGVPLLAMIVLRPLTYLPTFFAAGGSGLAAFWEEWNAIAWRGGPLWFLELLLLFDLVALAVISMRSGTGPRHWQIPAGLTTRPLRAWAVFSVLCVLAYLPLTVQLGSFAWVQVGPAQLQLNRTLLYAVYFVGGILLGAQGIDRSFLAPDSRLGRRWGRWTLGALAVFALYIVSVAGESAEQPAAHALYALSGATTSFAVLAAFLRFSRERRALYDSAFANSYGIYVVHYGIVAWVLYAGLSLELPAGAKWAVLSLVALALSWLATALLRRIPGVARVL